MNPYLDIRPEVADALASGRPVVALESTVIAHGLPAPHNLETARAMEAIVREQGAVPATIAVREGRLVVGVSEAELVELATAKGVHKVSRRDIAGVLQSRALGATTVSGTMLVAAAAGIRLFATGGIGGVHRGVEETLDISADLGELARTPVAVVCAGAKVILDLPRTLEMLESMGVPVVGYGTSVFPAFYVRDSGLALDARVDSPEQAAGVMAAQRALGLPSGILFCNPPPDPSALGREQVERWVAEALEAAARDGVAGKGVTPYLLSYVATASGGATLAANMDLLRNNARVAAQIAVADTHEAQGR